MKTVHWDCAEARWCREQNISNRIFLRASVLVSPLTSSRESGWQKKTTDAPGQRLYHYNRPGGKSHYIELLRTYDGTGSSAAGRNKRLLVHLGARNREVFLMPVFTTLPSLLALYRIDNELHDFQSRLTGVLKDQRELEASIKKLSADLAELESAGRKIQATISSYELDLKARQEHIEKMRNSLNTTKTNKEYSAILVQISAEKEEISKLE